MKLVPGTRRAWLAAVAAAALLLPVLAGPARAWLPREQKVADWFQKDIVAVDLVDHATWNLPQYISDMVTLRLPYLKAQGLDPKLNHKDVVEVFGTGKCGDIAEYVQDRFEKGSGFKGGILVIRGSNKLGYHGANLIVPTDKDGKAIMVKNAGFPDALPPFSEIFNPPQVGLLTPAQRQAWKDALVIDGWRKKVFRFEDWAKSYGNVEFFPSPNQDMRFYDADEELKEDAYAQGCQLRRQLDQKNTPSQELEAEARSAIVATYQDRAKLVRDEFLRGFQECGRVRPSASVVFVIDASGSMAGSKIEAAKKAVVKSIARIVKPDSGVEMALFAFSGCGSCTLLQGFTLNSAEIVAKLRQIRATGGTPIAFSLKKAEEYLVANAGSDNGRIILLSDGGESCQGNPVEAAQSIFQRTKTVNKGN